MPKSKTVTVNGPGFLSLLGLLFIGLKLSGIINWSWWLVLLPIYGPVVLVFAFISTLFFVGSVLTLLKN